MIGIAALTVLSLQTPDIERYQWVVLRGQDTISVERVTREPAALRAEVLVPPRARLGVVATTDARSCVTDADVKVFPWGSAPDATPLQHVRVRLDGDSVRVAVQAGDVSRAAALPARGARFVLAFDSYAASVLVVECALSSGADSVDVPAVAFPNLRMLTAAVRRHGRTAIVVLGDTSRVSFDERGRPVRVEVGAEGIVLERVAFDSAAGSESAPPDYSAPPGAPYTAEGVTVPVEPGVALAGTLTVPRDAHGPVPAVITVSGSGPQDRDCYADIGNGWRPFRQIAEALAAHGIAVLRFDDRGVGASTGDYAGGTELTVAEDVWAAVTYLRTRPEIDPTRVAVLGHSEGARVAMLVGAEDSTLAGLVLLSGAADPRAAVRAQALWVAEHSPNGARMPRDSLIALVDRQMDSLAVTGRREVFRWDAAALAGRIHVPVAVFQGATDRQVPADQADSLGAVFRRAGNRDVTIRVFPDVNHLLVHDPDGDFQRYDRLVDAAVADEVSAAIGDWLARRLTGGQ
jgi:alpha-beta hydrolase superfamily lysophospholipase